MQFNAVQFSGITLKAHAVVLTCKKTLIWPMHFDKDLNNSLSPWEIGPSSPGVRKSPWMLTLLGGGGGGWILPAATFDVNNFDQTCWLFLKVIWQQFDMTRQYPCDLTSPWEPYFDRHVFRNFNFSYLK